MKEIEGELGESLCDALQRAVAAAPARLKFNDWVFETRLGETLGDAKVRFEAEHGVRVQTNEEMALEARESLERAQRESDAAIAAAGVPTEKELREAPAPKPRTLAELAEYIKSLVERP